MAETFPETLNRAPTQVLEDNSDTASLERLSTWETQEESKLPDGGYGWVVVGSIFLINAHSWGMTSSYAVFLAYYLSKNIYLGLTSLDYAMIGGLSFSVPFLVAPLVNFCVRVLGSKPTLCIGVIFQTVAFIGVSFATEKWHLVLTQGVALGIGIGFMFDATAGIIPQWFTKGRAFANGLASGGTGTGGLIYSLATYAMVPRLGLAWTFRTLAIIQFIMCGICILLLKDRNKQIGSSLASFDIKLLKRLEFLLLLGWAFFSVLGYVILLFSLPNWTTSIGLTASQGAIVNAIANLGQAIPRPIVGHFADPAGCLSVATVGTMVAGLFCFLFWTFAHNFAQAIAFALLSGAVTGIFFALIAPVCARVIGLVELPAGLSVVWISIVLPALFSEPISVEMQRRTGRQFLNVQIFSGCMYFAAAACLFLVKQWKIREIVIEMEKRAGNSAEKEESIVSRTPSLHTSTSEAIPTSKWLVAVKCLAKFSQYYHIR